jgi:hypothetical protein
MPIAVYPINDQSPVIGHILQRNQDSGFLKGTTGRIFFWGFEYEYALLLDDEKFYVCY